MDRSQIKACGTLQELRGILRKRYKFVLKVDGTKDDWLLRCEGEKAILESAWKSGPERPELIIYVENTDDMAGILESFIKFGGKVYACEEREMSLAEIFGKITGRRMTTDSENSD
jgi:ABC-type multidrug transport system ATPase subunit